MLILTACNSTTISLVELDELPENVEEKMDQNATLQKSIVEKRFLISFINPVRM